MPEINVPKYEARAVKQGYIHRTLGQLDVFLNVLAGGAPDDTISSRMQRWKINDIPNPNKTKQLVGKSMCWWLGKIQKNHDLLANAGDLGRAKAEEARTQDTLKDSGVQE